MKKLHVEAQKARMWGFSCTVPPNRSNGSSVDFKASLTAHLKVGVSAAVGVPGIVSGSFPSVIELDEVSIFQPAECFSRRRDCWRYWLRWNRCNAKNPFVLSLEKISMRESGGEEDTFADLLPNKLCDDLIWICWDLNRMNPMNWKTFVAQIAKIMSMSTSFHSTFFKRNCHSTHIYWQQPILVRSAIQAFGSQRYDCIPLVGKIRCTHFAEEKPRPR